MTHNLSTALLSTLLLMGLTACGVQTQPETKMLERLIESHMNRVGVYIARLPEGSGEIIRKNITEDIKHMKSVMGDAVSARVGRTLDTDCQTIQFTDSKGQRVTFWLDSAGNINSISPY